MISGLQLNHDELPPPAIKTDISNINKTMVAVFSFSNGKCRLLFELLVAIGCCVGLLLFAGCLLPATTAVTAPPPLLTTRQLSHT